MRLLGVNHGPDFLHIKLSEVDLSDRARATLRKSGCSTIHDIITKWDEIRSLPEIKRSTLNEIWQDLIRAAPPGYRFARLPTSPKVRNLAAAISVTYSTDMDEFLALIYKTQYYEKVGIVNERKSYFLRDFLGTLGRSAFGTAITFETAALNRSNGV